MLLTYISLVTMLTVKFKRIFYYIFLFFPWNFPSIKERLTQETLNLLFRGKYKITQGLVFIFFTLGFLWACAVKNEEVFLYCHITVISLGLDGSLVIIYVNSLFNIHKNISKVRGPLCFNKISHTERKFFSTLRTTVEVGLPVWFMTGFVDAEVSFMTHVRATTSRQIGWKVENAFTIALHKKDLALLQDLNNFLGLSGKINLEGDKYKLRVSSKDDLIKIIAHFDNYPLVSQKLGDYLLWKQAVNLVFEGKHLTLEGIQEIVNIKASINLGLNENLNKAFPNTIPVVRPIVENLTSFDPNWVAGFVSGEGCFFIGKHKIEKTPGWKVSTAFLISQHKRDEALLRSFIHYFNCGSYSSHSKRNTGEYKCQDFQDNFEKIRGFFFKYPLRGIKVKDFQDWSSALELIKDKSNLTEEGLAKILKIKAGMNTGRLEE